MMRSKLAFRTAIALAVLSFAVIIAAVAVHSVMFKGAEGESTGVSVRPAPTVVIDAGHGGMDGGCVSGGAERILEKELNLEIAKTLAALFRISGYNAVMTREEDVMLDAEGLTGNAKMRDLRARLLIACEHPDALFISIHCNKFPDPACKGLQVYYASEYPESKTYAEGIQASAVALLQPDNHRVPKAAGSSIYILDRAKQPSVLIECGFLSSPSDTECLADPIYRKKLALAILLPTVG